MRQSLSIWQLQVGSLRKTMKTRSLLVLVGLALCFALPVLAQENDKVGPETRQQIEAVLKMREEAINKNDAATVAALYTQDATSIRSWESEGGLAFGRQAIVLRSSTCTGDDSHFFFADDDNWFGMMLWAPG